MQQFFISSYRTIQCGALDQVSRKRSRRRRKRKKMLFSKPKRKADRHSGISVLLRSGSLQAALYERRNPPFLRKIISKVIMRRNRVNIMRTTHMYTYIYKTNVYFISAFLFCSFKVVSRVCPEREKQLICSFTESFS